MPYNTDTHDYQWTIEPDLSGASDNPNCVMATGVRTDGARISRYYPSLREAKIAISDADKRIAIEYEDSLLCRSRGATHG